MILVNQWMSYFMKGLLLKEQRTFLSLNQCEKLMLANLLKNYLINWHLRSVMGGSKGSKYVITFISGWFLVKGQVLIKIRCPIGKQAYKQCLNSTILSIFITVAKQVSITSWCPIDLLLLIRKTVVETKNRKRDLLCSYVPIGWEMTNKSL